MEMSASRTIGQDRLSADDGGWECKETPFLLAPKLVQYVVHDRCGAPGHLQSFARPNVQGGAPPVRRRTRVTSVT